jgi:hypothetical protein
MRVGFLIYEALGSRYPLFRGEEPQGKAAEVFPNASALLLAGRARYPGETKQAFRRHVLQSCGVDDRTLPGIDRVDAALAAVTGLLALEGCWSSVGDPKEGVILLPVRLAPPAAVERATAAGRTCLCGCGAPVQRRFRPGHGAKLKSRLVREHRLGDRSATQQLRELGWLPE